MPNESSRWDSSTPLMIRTAAKTTWAFGTQILGATAQYGSPTETDLFQIVQDCFLPLITWES